MLRLLVGIAVTTSITGCGVVTPTATPPSGGIEIVLALGFTPPNVPPDLAIENLDDDEALVLMDDERDQELVYLQWDGAEWRVITRQAGQFLTPGASTSLIRMQVAEADGFPRDMLLILSRIPPGPINQLELVVDGSPELFRVSRPSNLLVLEAGAEVEDAYRAFDAGTMLLDEGTFDD